jgi:hypothetical protein
MILKCAECQCTPTACNREGLEECANCTKEVCCCINIHPKEDFCCEEDVCCHKGSSHSKESLSTFSSFSSITEFFKYTKGLYAAALGIEILCIAAAEIGENTILSLFGSINPFGIVIAYATGYVLAGFTTFVTILGRYNYDSNQIIDSCCSVLEQKDVDKRFISNLITTFRNFAAGLKKISLLHKQSNLKYILRTSLYILFTAESICILTAESVDLIFYKYSLILSVPLALIAGAFTVVAPEAYRKIKRSKTVTVKA